MARTPEDEKEYQEFITLNKEFEDWTFEDLAETVKFLRAEVDKAK